MLPSESIPFVVATHVLCSGLYFILCPSVKAPVLVRWMEQMVTNLHPYLKDDRLDRTVERVRELHHHHQHCTSQFSIEQKHTRQVRAGVPFVIRQGVHYLSVIEVVVFVLMTCRRCHFCCWFCRRHTNVIDVAPPSPTGRAPDGIKGIEH